MYWESDFMEVTDLGFFRQCRLQSVDFHHSSSGFTEGLPSIVARFKLLQFDCSHFMLKVLLPRI